MPVLTCSAAPRGGSYTPYSPGGPPHDPGDFAPSAFGGHTSEPRQQLLGAVAGALHDNLARGFLESEERIRQIAEALNDVILLSDGAGGRVYYVNAAYEEIWGRSRAELYANPQALLDGVHPEDREAVRDALSGEWGSTSEVEFRVVRPTGDVRWVWCRGFPVPDAEEDDARIASIFEDVTERKQVMESHDRLIRGFTHDVKNPLGAADGYLSLLEEGVFGDMSEAQRKSIAHARRSIGTALNLVSGLLEIERAEAGRLNIEASPMHLSTAVVDIVDEFHAAAAAKGIRLVRSIPADDEELIVDSDAARVRQILANLVSNAVKYTQPDGRVSVSTGVTTAHVAARTGRWATIAVSDNGPGIPVEKHAMVFREFTRLDPAAAAGSGIGLAISRRLAHALGGEITFTSTPGEGSTFTLWLPL